MDKFLMEVAKSEEDKKKIKEIIEEVEAMTDEERRLAYFKIHLEEKISEEK